MIDYIVFPIADIGKDCLLYTSDSCDKITELNLSNLGDLHTIKITSCPNLKSIICTNNGN